MHDIRSVHRLAAKRTRICAVAGAIADQSVSDALLPACRTQVQAAAVPQDAAASAGSHVTADRHQQPAVAARPTCGTSAQPLPMITASTSEVGRYRPVKRRAQFQQMLGHLNRLKH